MHYEPGRLSDARTDLLALGEDATPAASYCTTHLSKPGASDGGLLYRSFLDEHEASKDKAEELLRAVRTLYENAEVRIEDTVAAYADTEQQNQDEVKGIWTVLQAPSGVDPIGPPPPGGATRGPLPSTELAEPSTNVGHWIFDVLSWPDWLSAGTWVRRILGWIWQAFTGTDPWTWLWEQLGGDWEAIGLASDTWDQLGGWFADSSEELTTRMQIMFGGWYDSDAATASGSYFAGAAEAVDGASGPMRDLSRLYNNVAFSSFGLCQAVYSLIDAAIDSIVVWLLGGMTVAEAVAALFSGGATAIPAAATAVLTAIEAVSAAWGWMMTAVYGITGLAALLGAATTEVTWVAIPEG